MFYQYKKSHSESQYRSVITTDYSGLLHHIKFLESMADKIEKRELTQESINRASKYLVQINFALDIEHAYIEEGKNILNYPICGILSAELFEAFEDS